MSASGQLFPGLMMLTQLPVRTRQRYTAYQVKILVHTK